MDSRDDGERSEVEDASDDERLDQAEIDGADQRGDREERDPRILILDDALSSVDTLTEERILTHLAGVMRGRIVEMGTQGAQQLSAASLDILLRMLLGWFALFALVLSLHSQDSANPEEEAIRHIVDRYHQALRKDDAAGVRSLVSPGAKSTSPGGTGGGELETRRFPERWKNRTTLTRRIDVVSPGLAVVTGVWRSFDVASPFHIGTFHYTLVRGDAGWKVAYTYEAFLPDPANRRISAMEPDPAPGADEAGWISLFDGTNLDAWVSGGVSSEIRSSWRVENGSLMPIPKGVRAGLLTRGLYRYFELRFEWAGAAGSNSGIKYRLLGFDFLNGRSAEPMGAEYQIADDDGDPGAKADPRQRSGALYATIPVERSVAARLGEWNQGRILVTPDHVEHWLNGTMTARYEVDIPFASAILLQHHTTEVRFRNIRIRPL